MKKFFLLIGSLLFLLCASPVTADMAPGAEAIDFEARDLSGKMVRLSDFRGKPIVLKIATTWCPTCKSQSREFVKAGDFLEKNGVVLVEVFIQEKQSKVERYLERYDYPMTYVPVIDEGDISRSYGVYMIPRVLLIDRDFKIQRDGNILGEDALIKKLRPLIRAAG